MSAYSEAILADNPVGYWRLGDAGTTADDLGSGNHDGTYINSPTLVSGLLVGDGDGAHNFNGSNQYVQIGDFHDFAGVAPFSLEAWIRPDAFGSGRRIISKEDDTPPAGGADITGYGLLWSNTILIFQLQDGAGGLSQLTGNVLAPLNTTHYVVATYDGATMRLYLNGSDIGQLASSLSMPGNPADLAIGMERGGVPAGPFPGKIDEVAIWDRALSATEVLYHYGVGIRRTYHRKPVSFAGVTLNNPARQVLFAAGQGALSAPRFEEVSAARVGRYPSHVRLQPPEGKALPLTNMLLQPTEGQLRALFDLYDPRQGQQPLIVEDGDGIQRSVQCASLGLVKGEAPTEFVAPLWATDPVFLAVALSTVTNPAVTAAGATLSLSNAGDMETPPLVRIKPQALKSSLDGWRYLRRVILVNNSEEPLSDPASKGALGKGYPLDIVNVGLDTRSLISPGQLTTIADGGDGINASQTTIGLADASGFATKGVAWIGPFVSGEQVRYADKSGNNLLGCDRGFGGTTAQAFAEGTGVHQSKMVADGRDLAVFINGAQVLPERITLQGINTVTSKVFVPLEMPGRVRGTLARLAGSTEIELAIDGIDASQLSTPGYLRIDSEVIRFAVVEDDTDPNVTKQANLRVTGCTRGARNTTAASHSAGATVHLLPLDIRIAYGWGNAPVRPANPAPIRFNLATSTNGAWEWTGRPWSEGEEPGGWLRELSGQNRHAKYVALDENSGKARFTDMAPTALKLPYDSLSFVSPCGIDDAAGAVEYDYDAGWPFLLEVEAVDIGGQRHLLARRQGFGGSHSFHGFPASGAAQTETPAAPLRQVRIRARQAVVTGAVATGSDEALGGGGSIDGSGADAQSFTLDQDTDFLELVVRVKRNATSDKVFRYALRLLDSTGKPAGGLLIDPAANAWQLAAAGLGTSYGLLGFYLVAAAPRAGYLIPSGVYAVNAYIVSGSTGDVHWSLQLEPIYAKGSRFANTAGIWAESPNTELWFALLAATADNQPEAPRETGETLEFYSPKLTFDPARTPTIDLRPEEDAYYIDASISRAGQDALQVRHLQRYTGSRELSVDARTRQAIDAEYGDEIPAAVLPGDRADWLTLPPGTIPLSIVSAGAVDEEWTVEWRAAWQA